MPPTTQEQKEARLADAIGLPPQAVNNVWGQSTIGKRVFLTMPSGQTCWAQVLGLQGVLETGVMGEADSLSAFVGREYVRKVRGAKGRPDGDEIDAAKLMKSPDTLKKIVKMVDGLTPHVVVDPVVKCHYEVLNAGTKDEDTRMIPKEDREPGVIYTDQIGLEDKMFLFNFAVSAVKDAETFREESQAALGNMADGEDLPNATQHPSGSRSERRKRPKRRRSE